MKKEGKTKKIIFGIIGFIIVIAILTYFVILPLYERYDVQQACNTYGEGFKAVKYTDKIVIEKTGVNPKKQHNLTDAGISYSNTEFAEWYCLSPDGVLIWEQ